MYWQPNFYIPGDNLSPYEKHKAVFFSLKYINKYINKPDTCIQKIHETKESHENNACYEEF